MWLLTRVVNTHNVGFYEQITKKSILEKNKQKKPNNHFI